MNARLFFLMCMGVFLLGEVDAQVHLNSYGASIRIPDKAVLQCSGNISFADASTQSSKVVLNGSLRLKGDLLNEGDSQMNISASETGGSLVFASSNQQQYIRGTYGLRVPHLILSNPMGLVLEQQVDVLRRLTFLQGKIYAEGSQIRILNPDSTAISNFGPRNYIVGKLGKSLIQGKNVFPVGTDSHLQLLLMEIEQLTSDGYVEVAFSEVPGILTEDVAIDGGRVTELLDNGVWKLSGNTDPAPYFTLSLHSVAHTNGGTQEGMHTLLADKGTGWEAVGHTNRALGSKTNIRVTRSGIHTFGDFAVGKASYVLANPDLLPVSQFHISNNGSKERKIGISFSSRKSGAYTLELRDIRGRKLNTWNSFAISGNNEHDLDLSSFPRGIYLLTLQKDGQQLEHKIW